MILIQLYSKCLNKDIGTKIIINEPPATLSGWMRKASTLDGYTRRAENIYKNVFAITHRGSSKKKPWKPRFYEAKTKDEGGPMEIDRLKPQEEK